MVRRRTIRVMLLVVCITGCANEPKGIDYPRISLTAEPPASYLCIGAVSMYDNNEPGEPLYVLRKNDIKHEVYGDIWHTMISLYCSPMDIDSAMQLLKNLPERKQDLVYLLDKPVKQYK